MAKIIRYAVRIMNTRRGYEVWSVVTDGIDQSWGKKVACTTTRKAANAVVEELHEKMLVE